MNAIFEDLHRGQAAIVEAVSSMCLNYEMCQNYTKTSTKFDTQWLVLGRPEIIFRGDARIHQPHLKSNGRIVESRQNCMPRIYLSTRLMSSVQLVLASKDGEMAPLSVVLCPRPSGIGVYSIAGCDD